MNPFEFVLTLMAMIFIFQIIKHRLGIRKDHRGGDLVPPAEDNGEARMLRDEIRTLKERIQVLERITVEKENSLAREIEDLRNR